MYVRVYVRVCSCLLPVFVSFSKQAGPLPGALRNFDASVFCELVDASKTPAHQQMAKKLQDMAKNS